MGWDAQEARWIFDPGRALHSENPDGRRFADVDYVVVTEDGDDGPASRSSVDLDEVLRLMADAGIRLTLEDGDRLIARPTQAVNPEMLTLLRAHGALTLALEPLAYLPQGLDPV